MTDAPVHLACLGVCPDFDLECECCDGTGKRLASGRIWDNTKRPTVESPRSEMPDYMLDHVRKRDAERSRRYRERKKNDDLLQVQGLPQETGDLPAEEGH